MKWTFRRLPPMNGSTRTLGCCCSPRRTNANVLGLVVNACYANDNAGGMRLSFPKFSVGNLKYEKAILDSRIKIFHHEAREEHEGLGLMVVIL